MKTFKKRLILSFLVLWLWAQPALAAQLVVPGGQVIGLELMDGTVHVAAFDKDLGQGAKTGGLQVGDRIVAINGKTVTDASQIRQILKTTDGNAEVSVIRAGEIRKIQVQPAITAEGPRLGVYLKEGITGVGTVTWYEPESQRFGALGHGVNQSNGQPVKMAAGNVYPATVLSVKKGKSGAPGQLMSAVSGAGVVGKLNKNTAQGVFGNAKLNLQAEPLPLGTREDVKPGPATIRSTVGGSQVQEYSVKILKVYPNSRLSDRNMLLQVTDPALLETTGGIVQGMSGSPIIQDGKLVGAVTHVLVNDPTMGYGIFIENMLDAAA